MSHGGFETFGSFCKNAILPIQAFSCQHLITRRRPTMGFVPHRLSKRPPQFLPTIVQLACFFIFVATHPLFIFKNLKAQ